MVQLLVTRHRFRGPCSMAREMGDQPHGHNSENRQSYEDRCHSNEKLKGGIQRIPQRAPKRVLAKKLLVLCNREVRDPATGRCRGGCRGRGGCRCWRGRWFGWLGLSVTDPVSIP